MKNIIKSPKTLKRIEAVKIELNAYKNSIMLLDAFAQGRKVRLTKIFSDHSFNYKRTPEDEERYRETKKIIKSQMQLLKKELSVLIEYGI